MTVGSCEFESHLLHNKLKSVNAEIAQLVEHNLAKVGVASSSLVFRSVGRQFAVFFCLCMLRGVLGSPAKVGGVLALVRHCIHGSLQP